MRNGAHIFSESRADTSAPDEMAPSEVWLSVEPTSGERSSQSGQPWGRGFLSFIAQMRGTQEGEITLATCRPSSMLGATQWNLSPASSTSNTLNSTRNDTKAQVREQRHLSIRTFTGSVPPISPTQPGGDLISMRFPRDVTSTRCGAPAPREHRHGRPLYFLPTAVS